MTRWFVGVSVVLLSCALDAQQVADRTFRSAIAKPAYPLGTGPVILFDEGHFNFHTSTGRYSAFVDPLTRDGYRIRPSRATLSSESLFGGAILVIAGALNEQNERNEWKPPYLPAFTRAETSVIRDWVANGAALLLIADHAPFDAAVAELAEQFGVQFLDRTTLGRAAAGTRVFRKVDGTLAPHQVTSGIDEVARLAGLGST